MAAKLSSSTSTTQCPGTVCTCGGTEQVTVRKGFGKDRQTGERRPTLTYGPCASLVAQGWQGKVAVVAWA